MRELDGKVAVVTGAASGIGLGMAQRFAAEGMRVVMADVERNWFRRVLGGEEAPGLFWTPENEDGDFDDVDTADVHEAFAAWTDEIENARAMAAAAETSTTSSSRVSGKESRA